MSRNRGTILLIVAIAIGFGIELITNSVGNDAALLKLGALPDDGRLHGEVWRIATYSFLHFNCLHLLLNVGLLFWIGRSVEKQVDRPGSSHLLCQCRFVSNRNSARPLFSSQVRRDRWRVGRSVRLVRRGAGHCVSAERRPSLPDVALDCTAGRIRNFISSGHQHGWSHRRSTRRRSAGMAVKTQTE